MKRVTIKCASHTQGENMKARDAYALYRRLKEMEPFSYVEVQRWILIGEDINVETLRSLQLWKRRLELLPKSTSNIRIPKDLRRWKRLMTRMP